MKGILLDKCRTLYYHGNQSSLMFVFIFSFQSNKHAEKNSVASLWSLGAITRGDE